MVDFVPAAKTTDLKPGQMKQVMLGNKPVLLANVGGTFYAISDRCGHQKASLSKGKLEGEIVECPLHFARFNVRTGKMVSGPDFNRLVIPGMDKLGTEAMQAMQRTFELISSVPTEDVSAYEVRVDKDTVLVKL